MFSNISSPPSSTTGSLAIFTAMKRVFLLSGSLFGFLGVAAGALGTHGLSGKLTPAMLNIFEIAVRYQIYHALVLLILACLSRHLPTIPINLAGWFITTGTFIFSGTLFILSLSGQHWWGAITPFGGLALLAGWSCLIWAACTLRQD